MNAGHKPVNLEAQFRLACAWHSRGKLEVAAAALQRILRDHPAYPPACSRLGEILLEQGRPREALEQLDRAVELDPDNTHLLFRRNYVRDLLYQPRSRPYQAGWEEADGMAGLPDQPGGKINLNQQKRFQCHRSGWNDVLQALEAVHNSRGIRFDGFVENNFAWKHWRPGLRDQATLQRLRDSGTFNHLATSEERGITPYRQDWLGVLHNPQGMPEWFHFEEAPQTIFSKAIWQQSAEYCRGLFTFSDYHASWLREQTGLPVSVLVHPTEIPARQFDLDGFLANPRKKIVQLGWWLRRLSAIYELPLADDNVMKYEKLRLVPMFFDNADAYLKTLIEKELYVLGLSLPDEFRNNTREVMHLSNSEYDELLSRNLAFVQLYDANANNAVVECIARATPLLVNPLPAVVEYLGESYPLYFEDLDEAAEKALDVDLVSAAHQYLKSCPTRQKLSHEHFLRAFVESDLYGRL